MIPQADTTATEREASDRALFDAIADKYAKKDLVSSSATARKHRLLRTIASLPREPGRRILEVGCGAGYSATYLAGSYGEFVGIDYSSNLIDYARARNAQPQASFETANVKDFVPEREFDLVLMIGVLHHIDHPGEAMSHMVRMLRPGGWLVANEPQPGNPLVRFARRARRRVDSSYSDDQCELSAKELRQMYLEAGLEEIRIRPQGIFSTPFAEVVLQPQFLTAPLSHVACWTDRFLEGCFWPLLGRISWNLIAAGRKPSSSQST